MRPNRIVGKIFGGVLIGGGLVAVGTASAAQLRLNWIDNAGGISQSSVVACLETAAEGRSNSL